MITLLSPAKTLDFDSPVTTDICTEPDFISLSDSLIQGLAKLSPGQIRELMSLSPKLAELNHQRFRNWSLSHKKENSKQALLAFK